jgi:sterol 24-C-methyltransferase
MSGVCDGVHFSCFDVSLICMICCAGWGQSFHFAYQLKGESFKEAVARHEYFLAGRLGVKQGDQVLDVGCGIGGPMRNIARCVNTAPTP